MPKRSGLLMRFFLLLTVITLLLTVASFVVSSRLSNASYDSVNRAELERAMNTGRQLLTAYAQGRITRAVLQSELNPTLNPGSTFLMLLDDHQRVLAYTDSAVPYLSGNVPKRMLDALSAADMTISAARASNGYTLLMSARVENIGYIITGKPLGAFTNAGLAFRTGLVLWLAPMFFVFFLLSILAMRRMARPAQVLTEAAAALSEGSLIQINDDLPGEMGEISRAFNHMSRTLSRTISALTYEKDTMALVLEGLQEGLIAIDTNGRIIHSNRAAHALLGGETSNAYGRVLSALRQALALGKPMDGKIVLGDATLQYLITGLPEKAGETTGVVALIRDVTEQENLERTRYDYVANISHELRTPLASMRGIAEGLRDGLVTAEADKQKYYNMIVDEVLRLSRLVNDLLELSSLQSNPAAFETERIDTTEWLYELQDRNERLFAQKGIALSLALPEGALPEIVSNEDRLTQVMTIFLDNARKYTPEGGTVSLGARLAPGGVTMFVRDSGIGMNEQTMKKAFDRFHQAERGRSDKGSGLGLSIAREVLYKMNIDISVRSEPGKGSEFSFTVPVSTLTPACEAAP